MGTHIRRQKSEEPFTRFQPSPLSVLETGKKRRVYRHQHESKVKKERPVWYFYGVNYLKSRFYYVFAWVFIFRCIFKILYIFRCFFYNFNILIKKI
jgi:hypothetical protein